MRALGARDFNDIVTIPVEVVDITHVELRHMQENVHELLNMQYTPAGAQQNAARAGRKRRPVADAHGAQARKRLRTERGAERYVPRRAGGSGDDGGDSPPSPMSQRDRSTVRKKRPRLYGADTGMLDGDDNDGGGGSRDWRTGG